MDAAFGFNLALRTLKSEHSVQSYMILKKTLKKLKIKSLLTLPFFSQPVLENTGLFFRPYQKIKKYLTSFQCLVHYVFASDIFILPVEKNVTGKILPVEKNLKFEACLI